MRHELCNTCRHDQIPGIGSVRCVAIAGWLYAPEPAHACSYMRGPAVLQGYPVEGQIDVPTDVRPVFSSFAAWIDDFDMQSPVFELATASGQSVAVTPRRSFIGGFEVIPDVALESQTVYTLTGRWTSLSTPPMEVSVSLSFTTGAVPCRRSAAIGLRVIATLRIRRPRPVLVQQPKDGHLRLVPRRRDGQVHAHRQPRAGVGRLPARRRVDRLPAGRSLLRQPVRHDQGTPFECIKLSARAPNGTFGEPLMLCGRDGPSYGLSGSRVIACTSAGLTHDGRLASRLTTSDERRILTQGGGGGCALAGEPQRGRRAADGRPAARRARGGRHESGSAVVA